jgi:CBS domain-containing protein
MKVKEIMTSSPAQLRSDATVAEAAELMRARDIGSVVVTDANGDTCGIVTDRDLALRCLAGGQDPRSQRIGDIATRDPRHVGPETDVDEAIRTMREIKVRRLPVMDGGRTVGVISLGDLAVARDPHSVLGEISSAPPNN